MQHDEGTFVVRPGAALDLEDQALRLELGQRVVDHATVHAHEPGGDQAGALTPAAQALGEEDLRDSHAGILVPELLDANGCMPAGKRVAVALPARRFTIAIPASA
ncbi:MAG: hypothetical protein AMXMBFR78_30980 [Rubrivivax sp.]